MLAAAGCTTRQACSDLEAGCDWFEQQTGVRPGFGGVHTGRGTHNALASLGSSADGLNVYLEVGVFVCVAVVYLSQTEQILVTVPVPCRRQLIAPDPDQDAELTKNNIWYDFSFTKAGNGGQLKQWAAGTDTLAKHQQAAVSGDPSWLLEEPFRMQRDTPEGDTLIWSLATPPRNKPSADGGILPFLIVRTSPDLHASSVPSGVMQPALAVWLSGWLPLAAD